MAALEWRDAYLVMALTSIAALPIAYLLVRKHRRVFSVESSGRLDIGVLKNRAARYLIVGYSLHAFQLYAVRVWLPAFLMGALVSKGIDSGQAAVTAATVGGIALAVGSVGPVMGGIISDRWGRANSAAAIFVLSGACSLAIGWLGEFPWAVIVAIAVVYGWSIAADSAIYSTGITEVAERAHLGSTQALQAFIGFMSGVVGPILVGGVLDLSPESLRWGLSFSFLGFTAVVAVATLTRLRRAPESALLAAGRQR